MSKHLTRHKISDREPAATFHAAKAWMANTQNETRSLARGSLHRLVRPLALHDSFRTPNAGSWRVRVPPPPKRRDARVRGGELMPNRRSPMKNSAQLEVRDPSGNAARRRERMV